jgi:2-polyprenyl-3-methyl-5-hydroxy-6-metoxy-1,4-benzoquinol methylase
MMNSYGGPLKGGMPIYKYIGNRILTTFENKALNMNLTEFHSGYRAYSLHALKHIDLSRLTNDFHFDTEIIIKLHHQGYHITEVAIPTYYGDEICYVNGMKYALDICRAIYRYNRTTRSIARYPEYNEYFVHYPVKQSTYSSHHLARATVAPGDTILDIGCGRGVFAEQIVAKGCRVTGVDILSPAQVSPTLDSYIQADLLRDGMNEVVNRLGARKFDKILLLDVIEHLPDPARIVKDCLKLLDARGQLIISVPNVANISVRLMLMMGRFDYTERGILDNTHLRFFTRRTIRELLEAEGCSIVSHQMTVIPLEILLSLSLETPVMRIMHGTLILLTRMLPGLFGYQSFITAKPRKSSA